MRGPDAGDDARPARRVHRGDLLWWPTPDWREASRLGRYVRWLEAGGHRPIRSYDDLWRWSITDVEGFWRSIWDFFEITADRSPQQMLDRGAPSGAAWCPGVRLNYAENLCGRGPDDAVAILARSPAGEDIDLTWAELREQVRRARAGLQRLGVGRGDHVAGYLPNVPEALIAFLATASLGATWAACAPEGGARSAVARLAPLAPRVLVTGSGHRSTAPRLPTVEQVIEIGGDGEAPSRSRRAWSDLVASDGPLEFEPVEFDHPLYVLFVPGHSGRAQALVHGHGGILLEHAKSHGLHLNLAPGGRLQWHTTTGRMTWYALVSGLLAGASIVMADGYPSHPDPMARWQLAAQTGATTIGLDPAYLMTCVRAGLTPGRDLDLGAVRQLCVLGTPPAPDGYGWVYEAVGSELLLNVAGADPGISGALVTNNDMLPVWAGEISACALGVAASVLGPGGRGVVGEPGELTVTEPLPSVTVPSGHRAASGHRTAGGRGHAPGLGPLPASWRDGDRIELTDRGSWIINGHSDTALDRGGVRLESAALYAAVEALDEVLDSLVIQLEDPEGGQGRLVLFVVLGDGHELDRDLRRRIRTGVRRALSPRHVPDDIRRVASIPRTFTGEKLEAAVKRMLLGDPPQRAVRDDSLVDPAALEALAAMLE